MAVKIAQTKTGTSTLASTVVAFNNNVVLGNFIVVAVATNITSDVSGITDTLGNAYVNACIGVGTGVGCEIWYAKNILGGANTVTVAYTSGATAAVIIQEYSGLDTVTVLDRTSTSSGNSTNLTSGATSQTNQQLELCIGVGGAISGTLSAGGNYVNLTQISNATITVGIEDLSVISVGTQTATFTTTPSGQWATGIATFRYLPQGTTTSTSSTSTSSTSTSSTSTSTSVSSTSKSTSSTSTSTSSTSKSTSTSSTSTSTSSTSSSTSSTSTSVSSTSTSSTSQSTSVSSTSSSVSSTSVSSTSTSSTSASSSISSISTSISSTSSSISSTSVSTSSTSVSTSSTSSSTSTTTIPYNLNYTYEDKTSIPSTNAQLTNIDTSIQYGDVSVDDGDYFIQYGSEYVISQFKYDHINNTDNIQITWKGRSTLSPTVSPILLQLYNNNSASWETVATNTFTPADVDFVLKYTQTTNLSVYYDSNQVITARVYQLVI